MRIDMAVRHRRPLSLTPLIDVIFLLLLFFMLSSTFARFAQVEVTAGQPSASASAEQPDVLIRIDGEAESWRINGRTLTALEATSELGRLEENGAESAVLLVRGEMTSQALVGAVERIRRETGLELSVSR